VRVIGFAAAAFVLAGIPTSDIPSAGALTGNAGPLTVSTTESAGDAVTNVSIHAEAPAGTVIYELRAHLCNVVGLALVDNTYDFGYQGQRCANVPLGGGDVETIASYQNGSQSADLQFHAGRGSLQWVNELGYSNTLECGPGSPCLLVVQAQITDKTVFFNAALCYGVECPAGLGTAPSAPAPPAAPPPAAAAVETPPSATGASSTPASTAPAVGASNAGATAGGHAESRSTGVADGTRSTSRNAALGAEDRELDQASPASSTLSVSTALLSQRERVFLAAIVGALGCARIVHVMTRARRPTTLVEA